MRSGTEELEHFLREVTVSHRRHAQACQLTAPDASQATFAVCVTPTRKPNQSPGYRQTRPPRGDRLDQMRHEIDVRTSGVGDEISKVPGLVAERSKHTLQVRHEAIVEERQPVGVVIGEVARGQLGRCAPVGSHSRLVADRQQRAKPLHLVGPDRAQEAFNWNSRLRRSSSEAYALPSDSRLIERHNWCSFSQVGSGS